MEAEIEAQHGFYGGDCAGDFPADLLRFQHGKVGIYHVETIAARSGELGLSLRRDTEQGRSKQK
jgi:hypothetical protein